MTSRLGAAIAKLTAAWRLNDLGGKPEGLAFTAGGCAIVALDKRKSRRNLAVLAPAIASRHGGAKAKKNARLDYFDVMFLTRPTKSVRIMPPIAPPPILPAQPSTAWPTKVPTN